MEKEIIFVPKNKCPLDTLAEMGEKIKNSWINFDQNLVEELAASADICFCTSTTEMTAYKLTWRAKNRTSKTEIVLKSATSEWFSVGSIFASDIAFKYASNDPDSLYFLTQKPDK